MTQAILITAYKEFNYLVEFSSFLARNDMRVYIHIDKKVRNAEIMSRLNAIDGVVAISEYVIPWGGYSTSMRFSL